MIDSMFCCAFTGDSMLKVETFDPLTNVLYVVLMLVVQQQYQNDSTKAIPTHSHREFGRSNSLCLSVTYARRNET